MNGQKVTKKISLAIGLVLSGVLLIIGYNVFQGAVTRAEDSLPRDVVVSEISHNSVKISWSTGQDTQGVVEYGSSPTGLNFFAPESQKSKLHSVDLTLLSPSTTYYFQIRVADKKYDNSGVPWTFTTKSSTGDSGAGGSQSGSESSETVSTSGQDSSAVTSSTCGETDCEKIKEKFFSGCDTQDYVKCIKREASQ